MGAFLCHVIVLLTAISTLFAGVPKQTLADDAGTAVVSAQKPAGDDDAGKPRGENNSEESEEEDKFEVELLAAKSVVCGPRADIVVSIDLVNRADGRRLAWPTVLIRGPPAMA